MKKKYYLLFFLSVIAFNVLFGASADHLIFSRVSTIPNEAEAISIYNPTSDAIPLNNLHDIDNPNRGAYFLTDGYVSDDSHKHYTNIPFINNGYKIINELYEADFSYCGSLGEFVFSDKPDSLYNIIINENHNDEVILSYFNKINLDCDGVVDECGLCNGPGIPNEAGLLKEIISLYSASKSILGVCLGHQAIAEVFGAELINLKSVYHGVATEIRVTKKDPIFKDLPSPLKVGRYHSWIVKEPLPKELESLAHDENGQLMALKHKLYDVRGVQFHPESILTEGGKLLLNNWLKI